MRKSAKHHLTPYQQVEHNIRETSHDEPSDNPPKRVGDLAGQKLERAYARDSSRPNNGPTNDDLAPEILIREDGARSPNEPGDDIPADRAYRVVRRDEAGGTYGLDEAELARIDPLDGEPWDAEDDEG